MKTLLKLLLAGAALSAAVASAGGSGRGEDGWPLPFPFPWAKECPMDWDHLAGNYNVKDSTDTDSLLVKVTVLTKKGIRLVRVSRYSHSGKLIFDGTTTVTEKQKVVSLWMDGMFADAPRVWAVIKMHYDSSVFSCAQDHLVPILTMEALDISGPPEGIDYRMIRCE
jgi:hypothetical protein